MRAKTFGSPKMRWEQTSALAHTYLQCDKYREGAIGAASPELGAPGLLRPNGKCSERKYV